MCTVTFVPSADGGYWLGCNRDERPRRARAEAPQVHGTARGRFAAPRDPDGGGTWIAAHSAGVTWCLLNGARVDQEPAHDPDAPSRGLLVWELARRGPGEAAAGWLEERCRDGHLRANPFRLLVAEAGTGGREARLTRWRWNGVGIERAELSGLHLEVSHGLDPEGAWRRRGESFRQVADAADAGGSVLTEALRCWHASHFPAEQDRQDLSVCLHLEQAGTVSFTQVRCTAEGVEMQYHEGAPCQPGPARRVVLDRGD